MVDKKASDLFFTTFSPVMIKIDGKIMPVNQVELSPKMVRQAALELMNETQLETFTKDLEIDFAMSEAGARPIPRERLPSTRQRCDGAPLHHSGAAAARRARHAGDTEGHDHAAPRPDLDGRRQRLGQVDDARGDDRYRNKNSASHIVTIEDPIEFLHSEPEIDCEPARGWPRHATLTTARCAARCARRRT